LLASRPLSVSVDMTSAVKYDDNARIGRAPASVGPSRIFMDGGYSTPHAMRNWGMSR
jgi:hypothetical protein